MAGTREALLWVLFWGLVQFASSECNVSCATDFISTVNCSSSGAPPDNCVVEVECSDDDDVINGSCEIGPSQHWCTMQPDKFDLVVCFNTNCTGRVKSINRQRGTETSQDLAMWKLRYSIKPRPPFNLTLTEVSGGFNLTWSTVYTGDDNFLLSGHLVYHVRLRTGSLEVKSAGVPGVPSVAPLYAGRPHLPQEPLFYKLEEDRRFQLIERDGLQNCVTYLADVKATVKPGMFRALWSDWSSGVELRTVGEDGLRCKSTDNVLQNWAYLSLLMVVPVVVICVKMWAKKPLLFHYIPNPEQFFKPLYHTYEGDFKKWVGPVLTLNNFDVPEKSTSLQVVSEKTPGPLETDERRACLVQHSSSADPGSRSPPRPYFFGADSHGADCSAGHISIDTVTVSGEEDGGGRALGAENQRAERPAPGRDEEDWLPQEDVEAISLSSYSSSEHSEDGYPRVGLDLDTIDSGFLESDCSSPGFDGGERAEMALLKEVEGPHSNYVKQWIAFPAAQEGEPKSTGC
ncbi:interleukin 21 receptor, tandem duplicate 1 isoform X2 [Denticeps clupeoides]|uniref:interleukin 21 receptor, tandem duplicate 1 isoform X2 n=1 Tax=Denticeps clupeoides TaxID=299321 RepID=UPI0010A4A95B|nr:interleukin-21 receptor isoform X2 [Denticeps clupeoides]